jgi:serine/threonine-protein kinase
MKTIGKYQVLGELGRSVAGATYRTRDPFQKRDFAVKVLSPVAALSEEAKDQLCLELAAYGELSHRNIAKIHDLGEVDGGIYLATELFTGADLRSHLAVHDSAIAQKLTWIAQVCEGLASAHSKEIAHGNLKPSNIFLREGKDAAILDFGVGRWQSMLVAAGVRLNGLLPNYLAPEQILGQGFDARSDIFSVAVVLYEIVTGRYPFEAAANVIPREIVHTDAAPLRQVNSQLPEDLEQLVSQALKKDPQARLQNANEFAASLYAIALRLRRESAATPAETVPAVPLAVNGEPPAAPLKEVASVDGSESKDPPPQAWTAPAPVQQEAVPVATRDVVPIPAPPPTAPALQIVELPQTAVSFAPGLPSGLPAAAPTQAPERLVPRKPPVAMPQPLPIVPPPANQNSVVKRMAIIAIGAVLAASLASIVVSRQHLGASQSQPQNSPADAAPATPATSPAPDAIAPAPVPTESAPAAAQPAVPSQATQPAPEAILRTQVKPLWEAGRYGEALQLVDSVLAASPTNYEARAWKKKIRAAQDAEAAMK